MELKAKKIRGNIVVKSHRLITAKYEYSWQALKLANILISLIKKNYKKEVNQIKMFNENGYVINYNILAELFNINDVKHIKDTLINAINDLDRGKIWIDQNTYVNLISAVKFGVDGEITFYFHNSVEQHLLNLGKKFASFRLENILNLNTTYSIKLYEFLIMNKHKGFAKIAIDELKQILQCNGKSFNNTYNFKRVIIEYSKKIIEENTDINFKYRFIKGNQSKAYKYIEFYDIVYKENTKELDYQKKYYKKYNKELLEKENENTAIFKNYKDVYVPNEENNSSLYNHLYRNYYSNICRNYPVGTNFEDYIKHHGYNIITYANGGKHIDTNQLNILENEIKQD